VQNGLIKVISTDFSAWRHFLAFFSFFGLKIKMAKNDFLKKWSEAKIL